MKITLQNGNRIATIEGNDAMISEDLCYQGTFERQVTKVTNGFYGTSSSTEVKKMDGEATPQ